MASTPQSNDEHMWTKLCLELMHCIKARLGRCLKIKKKINGQSMGAIMNTWGSHIKHECWEVS